MRRDLHKDCSWSDAGSTVGLEGVQGVDFAGKFSKGNEERSVTNEQLGCSKAHKLIGEITSLVAGVGNVHDDVADALLLELLRHMLSLERRRAGVGGRCRRWSGRGRRSGTGGSGTEPRSGGVVKHCFPLKLDEALVSGNPGAGSGVLNRRVISKLRSHYWLLLATIASQ